MSPCRTLIAGILAAVAFVAVAVVDGAQYSSNMFLNGDYQNGLKFHPEEEYRSNPAASFISMLSKRASPFVAQMYLPTLLECRGRQQCVPKNKCANGYFTQQLPSIQNCSPEENVCCTYNPPTPAPTTKTPYDTCSSHMACVASRDCRNGEILSNAVVNLENKKCFKPNLCCGIPSTMLTQDGYVLKTPPTPLTYPAPEPFKPTTPVSSNYLPPKQTPPTPRPPQQPQRPVYTNDLSPKPQPSSPVSNYQPPAPTPSKYQPPAPTPSKYQPPAPTPSKYQPPAPTPSKYQPPAPTPSKYQPPAPTPSKYQPPGPTPSKYQPPAPTPPRRVPTPTPPKYLPPTGDRETQPSNQDKQIFRGEDQLSPQIFPPARFPNKPGQPQPQPQPQPRPQPGPQPGTPPQPHEPSSLAPCASALVCTEEKYCSSIGVISETPVEISPFRVPLTSCFIEGSGALGKCCRDPNYVDPWPVNLAGVCAQRNKNTKPKGVKDIDTNFAEIPWQAMVLKESSKSLLCGGAIIGDTIVLTTASCVKSLPVNDLRVKAGEWQLGSTSEPLNFQLVGVKSVEVHPSYNGNSGSNDMAVLHLTDRLQFATHIQPICISDKDPSDSETCVTTGWGKQSLAIHEEGAIMHVTTTKPVSRSDCGADSSGVCSTTKFDSCEFDTGSALACGTGSNVLLKGIYSVENACGEGQVVRFIKPDVAWVNKQFLERSKPLLLRV